MQLEFIITISTMILGFLGVFIMMMQQNQQINSKFDKLETDLNSK